MTAALREGQGTGVRPRRIRILDDIVLCIELHADLAAGESTLDLLGERYGCSTKTIERARARWLRARAAGGAP